MAIVKRAEIFETEIDDSDQSEVSRHYRHLNGVSVSSDGNELIFANTAGICLTSPDGTKFRLSVDNNGILQTTEVT